MKKEENKEASFLNSGYRRTIKSFNMFAEGNVEESIKILFDSNLKNKSYKNDSVKRMLELKINF